MYTYPPTGSPAYRLAAAGKCYPTRRGGPCLGIVLHITAGLQDTGMVGTDSSAESVAKWAASGAVDVSWHVGVDSDSIVPCLPSTYTGWHAKGYNSRTFGIEISKLDVDWSDMPAAWVTATLTNAARALAPIVVQYGLPLALRTKAQVDAAIAANDPFGFVYHSTTSAGTRSDPGKNFPIGRLFDLIRAEINGATTATPAPEEDDMQLNDLVNTRDPATGEIVKVPYSTILARTDYVYQETIRQRAILDAIAAKILSGAEVEAAAKAGATAAIDAKITAADVTLEVTP